MNIDQLMDLHTNVLEDLQACVDNWTNDSCVAEVFMTLVI